jgi:hypothetical protein
MCFAFCKVCHLLKNLLDNAEIKISNCTRKYQKGNIGVWKYLDVQILKPAKQVKSVTINF